MADGVRLIAFYLPQFHPIPENDEWWGRGFTEWTNVRRGAPAYSGHDQPRAPGELGYYDLLAADIPHRQAALATEYGVHGFCYYYYWFSGRRLLERPLDRMLADGRLNLPFCVCWANESWSRRWDGSEQDVLIEQKYLAEDPERFIRDLAPVLNDRRYIRVNGAPLLLVYRPGVIPDVRGMLRTWRQTAAALGIQALHVCGMQTALYASGLDDGFDAMVEFPPHSIVVGEMTRELSGVAPGFTGKIFSYADVVRYCTGRETSARLPVYRGVMTGWDNTARRGLASHIFHESSPERYEVWLRRAVQYTKRNHDPEHRLIFVNAWNEWAEGAYLEPDGKHGRRYLEATARALSGISRRATLIDDLRRLTAGNDEAVRVLEELDRELRVEEEAASLAPSSSAQGGNRSREGLTAAFAPLDGAGFDLPATLVPDEAQGFLDALNTPNYQQGVTVDRQYDVLIQGWIASRRVEAHANSPLILLLTHLESGRTYAARLLTRTRRDDVVAHLQAQRIFRRVPAKCALFSGFRAYLNVAAVEPGAYALDAVLPLADGRRGVVHRLHSGVSVV
jgi:hypothetical protein